MGSYGLANKITFYPSYPLYAYSIGMLETGVYGFYDDETHYSAISLNPSKIITLDNPSNASFHYLSKMRSPIDFFMVLGHDFEKSDTSFGLEDTNGVLSTTQVVNDCFNAVPEFNNWSLVTINSHNTGSGHDKMLITKLTEGECKLGSMLWGKSWTTPINCNVGQSYSVNFGYKQKKTVSGKTLSTLNYHKTGDWGKYPAWELLTEYQDNQLYHLSGESRHDRKGIRKWDVNFSYLQDSQMLSQNNMLTSNAWTQDGAGDYSTGSDGSSLYNTTNSEDFYSSVYKLTLGGHLPIVCNISDSKNPDQWAICRISKFTMKENNPKFIDVSMSLEEQV